MGSFHTRKGDLMPAYVVGLQIFDLVEHEEAGSAGHSAGYLQPTGLDIYKVFTSGDEYKGTIILEDKNPPGIAELYMVEDEENPVFLAACNKDGLVYDKDEATLGKAGPDEEGDTADMMVHALGVVALYLEWIEEANRGKTKIKKPTKKIDKKKPKGKEAGGGPNLLQILILVFLALAVLCVFAFLIATIITGQVPLIGGM